MGSTTVVTPDVREVSRQGVSIDALKSAIELCDIKAEPTDLEIKDKAGKVLKKIEFPKALFQEPTSAEDGADDRFQRAVAFIETLYPPLRDDKGNVIRDNNPLDIMLSHLSYSFDLTMRNSIRSKEVALLEGPDKAMLKQAEKLAQFKGISLEAALEKVKIAWGE